MLSGRVDSLELLGAEFKQVRCVVHLPQTVFTPTTAAPTDTAHGSSGGGVGISAHGEIPHGPPDLQLSFRASGLLGADLFRGVRLVLDLANKRVAVCQHVGAEPPSGHRRTW